MFKSEENVQRFVKYISIAHHVRGRVRFKFDTSILKEFSDDEFAQFASLENVINGVKGVSINKLAKSATVEYDHTIIIPSKWEELVACNNNAIKYFLDLRRS